MAIVLKESILEKKSLACINTLLQVLAYVVGSDMVILASALKGVSNSRFCFKKREVGGNQPQKESSKKPTCSLTGEKLHISSFDGT